MTETYLNHKGIEKPLTPSMRRAIAASKGVVWNGKMLIFKSDLEP